MKDYFLLIYTFMCVIIFLKIVSFQSHQTRILSVGLGIAWNSLGLSCIKLEGGGGLGLNGPAIKRGTFFCGFPYGACKKTFILNGGVRNGLGPQPPICLRT